MGFLERKIGDMQPTPKKIDVGATKKNKKYFKLDATPLHVINSDVTLNVSLYRFAGHEHQ